MRGCFFELYKHQMNAEQNDKYLLQSKDCLKVVYDHSTISLHEVSESIYFWLFNKTVTTVEDTSLYKLCRERTVKI
jgi:hypothetical protein